LDAESYLDWIREDWVRANPTKDLLERIVAEVFDSCQIELGTLLVANPTANVEVVRRELAAMGVSLE
jgi:hypothetical protein